MNKDQIKIENPQKNMIRNKMKGDMVC